MATSVRSNDSLGKTPSRPIEEVIAEYLQAVEANPALDRDSFVRQHPAWSTELREFIDSHDQVSRLVGDLLCPNPATQAVNVVEDLSRQVGDYQLLDVLGRGGMGVVYKARQISLDRNVALKMLGRDHDPGRFQGEAEAAASLDHPNIVAIYEIGQHEGSPFYSMQLVEGGDLRRLLASGPLPPQRAAELAAKIAGAVEFAHQRGILHRDLKPGNVLVDGQGEPFVADFGLARRVIDVAQRTDTGALLGTPSYMAPEQTEDSKKAITTSIDVYGLGALLYAMLTGRPPFEGEHPLQVIRQVADSAPQPPRTLQPSIPRDLEMICLKCLEKRPADRYHAAFDLQQDLLRFLRGEPVVARPLDWWERLWRRCRRNPIASSLGLTLVVLLFSAAIGGSALAWREYHARQLAVESGIRERDARREAETRLIDSYMNNGRQAQRLSRQVEALLWYANAAELAQETPQATDALVRVCRRQRFIPQPVRAAFLPASRAFGISYHPSGRYLSCHDGHSTFYLWDLATLGAPISIPDVSEVSAHAWNGNGDLLALGSQAGQLKVIDTSTGRLVLEHGMPEAVRAISLDSSGHRIAAASGKEFEIITLPSDTLKTAQIQKCSLPFEIKHLEFNPSASRVLACFANGSSIVIDTRTDAQELKPAFETATLATTPNQLGTSMHPFFVDDDRMAEYRDRSLRILDASNGSELRSIDVGSAMVWAYEPKRQFLAVGDFRQTRVWSLADGRFLGRRAHREPVTALGFHPRGDWLATGSLDGRINIWELSSGRMRGDLQHQSQISAVQFSPDGNQIATAQRDGLIRVWNMKPDSVARVTVPNPEPSTQGKLLQMGADWCWTVPATSAEDKSKLYRISPQTASSSEVALEGRFCDAAFIEDGKLLAVALCKPSPREPNREQTMCSELQFLRWPETNPVRPSMSLPAPVVHLANQPKGTLVAAVLETGDTLLIDSTTGRIVRRFAIEPQSDKDSRGSRQVVFSPNGQWLALFGGSTIVELYQSANHWASSARISEHDVATQVEFSPDSTHLVVVRESGEVMVWNLRDRSQVGPSFPHAETVYHAHFSPDGRHIATACADNFARIFDYRTGEMACQSITHWSDVFDASFSPDGRWLYTIGDNLLLGVWSTRDGGFVDQIPISAVSSSLPADERTGRILVSNSGESVVVYGSRRQFDFIELGDFEFGESKSSVELREAAELSASSRIETEGPRPLPTNEWLAVWRSYSQRRGNLLGLEFPDSVALKLPDATAAGEEPNH